MWQAIYNDGTILPQYSDDGVEKRFSDIDISRLHKFTVESNGHAITVNLRSGEIKIDTVKIDFDMQGDFRLIYYRTCQVSIGSGGSAISNNKVTENVGWQATIDGKNVRRIISLNDSIILRAE
jgi:hypothetical protein